MSIDRRTFFAAATATAGLTALRPRELLSDHTSAPPAVPDGFDPWIEVDRAALQANLTSISRVAGGRPVTAVIKNNGYGLGTVEVARALDGHPALAGVAVVKVSAAVDLTEADVRAPVLHMGAATLEEAREMAGRGSRLSVFQEDDPARVDTLAREIGGPVPAHIYVDTGMRRMGIPAHRALPWLERMAGSAVSVEGTFMGFTERDFDYEQLRRFETLAGAAREKGIELGRLHAASTHGLFNRPDAYLDMVRPGLAVYGGAAGAGSADFTPALRLRARVARVERLLEGDTVSYDGAWKAEKPTWTATLQVGHADGYPRRSVDGCEVLIGGRLYPVVGSVSASHTIVVLGDEPVVAVGDIATLIGPDDPAIHPIEVARRGGGSIYDLLMHLGQRLPRAVV